MISIWEHYLLTVQDKFLLDNHLLGETKIQINYLSKFKENIFLKAMESTETSHKWEDSDIWILRY